MTACAGASEAREAERTVPEPIATPTGAEEAPAAAFAADPAPRGSACAAVSIEDALACATLEADDGTDWARVLRDTASPAERGRSRQPDPAVPTAEETTALRAGRHLLCGAAIASADPLHLFATARALHRTSPLAAAALFTALVRAHPRHEVSNAATDLALDGWNRAAASARGDDRARCFAEMEALAVEWASVSACGGEPAREECVRLERVRCGALFGQAEAFAEQDPVGSSTIFERVHVTRCPNGDQALYNASLLARRGGDPSRAEALEEELRRAYPESSVPSPAAFGSPSR